MDQWSDTKDLQKVASPPTDAEPEALVDDAVSSEVSLLPPEPEASLADLTPEELPAPHAVTVKTFPKEFNKNYFEALDRRYLLIFIITLLLEPLVIWYLLRTRPLDFSDHEVAKLQNKYAELFLSEFKIEETPAATAPPATDILARASEAIPQALERVEGALPKNVAGPETNIKLPSLKSRRGNANPETRALSGENREAQRRLNVASRQRGMQAISEEVERIGLLGVITSGSSGLVSPSPVTDILQYADSTIGDIDNALAQVQKLRVPRAGVDYFGTSISGGGPNGLNHELARGEVYIADKELRGTRATSSGIMAEDIVTGLATASQKTIARNQQFETVASAPSLLPVSPTHSGAAPLAGISGLRGRPVKGPATRDRERIREIVLAHSPAIQDCYRRQLKGNAALKGKVSVRFTVNSLGYVSEVEIVKSEMMADGVPVQLPQMEECILGKIRKWRDFGQVDDSQGDVTFRQTYNFGY